MPRPRPVTEKRCPDCEQVKSLDEFYRNEKYDGGCSAYCIECARRQLRERRARNQEKSREKSRRSYHKNKHKHVERVRQKTREYNERLKSERPAFFRAKKFFDSVNGRTAEIAPDITRAYLESLFASVMNCQCCGAALQLAFLPREQRCGRLWHPRSPSIDRVNNKKGYARSNIAVICWECNHRKTDLTLDDLAMFERYIRSFGDV